VTRSFSFRSRLFWGALLAAVGLVPLVHLMTLHLVHRYPVIRIRTTVHGALLALLALACLALGVALVGRGLSPFAQLRARLGALRDGRERRIEGSYPAEVQPLVDDLNALLAHRDELVQRAMAKAGDLAHGLKTPLAVLAQEAERAKALGHDEWAATLSQQVQRMRRQIDYHLAHARAAAAGGAAPGVRCAVSACVEGLTRTLERLYAGRGLTIDVRVSPGHVVRSTREDLEEMLGNLLDNACKWARSRAAVLSSRRGATVVITVDDDGPGLSLPMRGEVLKRGVRADESAPGSGLGLAIVRDLVELHGGSIALETSPLGGLRAQLELPAANDSAPSEA
jgi:signal transduction histidine kinase